MSIEWLHENERVSYVTSDPYTATQKLDVPVLCPECGETADHMAAALKGTAEKPLSGWMLFPCCCEISAAEYELRYEVRTVVSFKEVDRA